MLLRAILISFQGIFIKKIRHRQVKENTDYTKNARTMSHSGSFQGIFLKNFRLQRFKKKTDYTLNVSESYSDKISRHIFQKVLPPAVQVGD